MMLSRVVHQLVRPVVLIERGIELMVSRRIPQVLLDSIVEDVLGSQGVRMGHAIMDRPRVKRVVLHATDVLSAAKMLNMTAAIKSADGSTTKMTTTNVATCSSMTAATKMAHAHMAATHVTATHMAAADMAPATHVAATTAVSMTGVRPGNRCEGHADADRNRKAQRADHGRSSSQKRGQLNFSTIHCIRIKSLAASKIVRRLAFF